MAQTTWKQVVLDTADAYREANGTLDKIPVGSLADKVRAGAGTPYTGPNPLTIGADGYSFDPKTLLKDGLTIVNGVNGEDLTDVEARMAAAVTELNRVAKRKVSEARNFGDHVWKKHKALPEGYTALEYIESTGTQYIDTGFIPNQDTRVIMDYQLTSVPSSSAALFGITHPLSADAYVHYRFFYSNGAFRSDYGYSTGQAWSLNATDRLVVDKNKETTTLGGTSHSYTNLKFGGTYNLYLLGRNNEGTANYLSSAKLYSCQIYDNGTLIRDYVPCKNASGEVGLYDWINCTFEGNSGTESFIAGSVVSGITVGPFEDYVINDDETAYPNGAIHTDGYYYEKGESGLNVWKKCNRYTIHMTQVKYDASPHIFQLSSDNVDLTKMTMADFEKFSGHTYFVDNNSTEYRIRFDSGGLYYRNANAELRYDCTYDPTTQQMTAQTNIFGGYAVTFNDSVYDEFIDYVVSDDPIDYPDGVEQDGYWYELADQLTPELFGCTEMAIDKYVPTQDIVSSSATIPHSLNKLPKIGIIIGNPTHLAGNLEKAFACFGIDGTGYATMTRQTTSGYTGVGGKSNTSKATTTTILLYEGATWFKAGVEYTIITLT